MDSCGSDFLSLANKATISWREYYDLDIHFAHTWMKFSWWNTHSTTHNSSVNLIWTHKISFILKFYFIFVCTFCCWCLFGWFLFYRNRTIFARHHVQHGKHLNNGNNTSYYTYTQTPHTIYKTVANAKKFTIFPHQIENLLNHVRPVVHPNKFQQIKL